MCKDPNDSVDRRPDLSTLVWATCAVVVVAFAFAFAVAFAVALVFVVVFVVMTGG